MLLMCNCDGPHVMKCIKNSVSVSDDTKKVFKKVFLGVMYGDLYECPVCKRQVIADFGDPCNLPIQTDFVIKERSGDAQ